MGQLLVLSTSFDATLDLIIDGMLGAPDDIFRLNTDLISQYQLEISGDRFRIQDPTGRVADNDRVTKMYIRKPDRGRSDDLVTEYCQNEIWSALRGVINHLWSLDRVVLVEPFAESARLDKLTQLRYASRYFPTPDGAFYYNVPPTNRTSIIVKSLGWGRLGMNAIYTTHVKIDDLDLTLPWYIQEYVRGEKDLTVVYVRGKQFAFSLDRASSNARDIADWREDRAFQSVCDWQQEQLCARTIEGIEGLMRDLKLHFGRIDFLLTEAGTMVFLEVNPNGQFAWLDLNDSTGLISAVRQEVGPHSPVHPIPYNPYGPTERSTG